MQSYILVHIQNLTCLSDDRNTSLSLSVSPPPPPHQVIVGERVTWGSRRTARDSGHRGRNGSWMGRDGLLAPARRTGRTPPHTHTAPSPSTRAPCVSRGKGGRRVVGCGRVKLGNIHVPLRWKPPQEGRKKKYKRIVSKRNPSHPVSDFSPAATQGIWSRRRLNSKRQKKKSRLSFFFFFHVDYFSGGIVPVFFVILLKKKTDGEDWGREGRREGPFFFFFSKPVHFEP